MHKKLRTVSAVATSICALFLGTAHGVVTVNLEAGPLQADNRVTVNVLLDTGGDATGGTQNDILFDSRVVDLPSLTRCPINPAIGDRPLNCQEDVENIVEPCKTLSRRLADCDQDPLPSGCPIDAAPGLRRLRGIIAATAVPNTIAIPDGSVLYSCTFDLVDPSQLPTTLLNRNIFASNAIGSPIDATGNDAIIQGSVPPSATASHTATATPSPPSTPTPSVTGGFSPGPTDPQGPQQSPKHPTAFLAQFPTTALHNSVLTTSAASRLAPRGCFVISQVSSVNAHHVASMAIAVGSTVTVYSRSACSAVSAVQGYLHRPQLG